MRAIDSKIDNSAPAQTGRLPAAQFNAISSELQTIATTAAIVLDMAVGPDSDLTMISQAMARYASGGVTYQDGGAANTYVLTTPGSFVTPKALFNGMWADWIPSATNTGPSTANVSGTATKPIVLHTSAALSGSEIAAGRPIQMFFSPSIVSGGAWVLPPWVVPVPAPAVIDYYAVDTGTANSIVISFAVAPASMAALLGKVLRVKLTNSISGTSTIQINGLNSVAVTRPDGTPTKSGDGVTGEVALMVYDGASVQILETLPNVGAPARNLVAFKTAGTFTFTVPAGVFWIYGQVVGAGGGGAGGGPGVGISGGGGGSGGFAQGWIAVTPGQTITVIVGAAGIGGAYGDPALGGNGSSSSLGSFMSATGAQGGSCSTGTTSTSGGAPGNGAGGQFSGFGGYGGDGSRSSNTNLGGAGGSSLLGGGGRTSTVTGNSDAGLAPGSGGGGHWGPSNGGGGVGADGAVIIQY